MKNNGRVLIVSTDGLQRDLILVSLRRMGFTCISCDQPEAVKRLLEEEQPAVLILDTFLHGANGLDLLADLQGETGLGETKVILISAMGFPETVRRSKELGASDFLVKPVDLAVLVERIRRLV